MDPWPLVKPILVRKIARVPEGSDVYYEPKMDGIRGLLHVRPRPEDEYFLSKNGHIYAPQKRFAQELAKEVRSSRVKSLILDGEIVAVNLETLKYDFNALIRGEGIKHYFAFDLLYLNGRDWRRKPWKVRKERLRRLIVQLASERIKFVEHFPDPSRKMVAVIKEMGLEGRVTKRASDPYASGTRWYKELNDEYTEKEGRYQFFVKRR